MTFILFTVSVLVHLTNQLSTKVLKLKKRLEDMEKFLENENSMQTETVEYSTDVEKFIFHPE